MVYNTSNDTWTTQRYYPWGTIRPDPNNALPTDYTFTGQKLDESTGLMYYGARYYDAFFLAKKAKLWYTMTYETEYRPVEVT